DGCSFSCNFCVIPLVRGASRSRSAAAVLDEVLRRVGHGHREIVLTGINLGCYRDRAAGYALPRLVREVGAVPGLERLRLSSIEINHVDADLVSAFRETPNLSRHLHVPLQSGDDRVLRDMGRRYSASTYLRRLEPLAGVRRSAQMTSSSLIGPAAATGTTTRRGSSRGRSASSSASAARASLRRGSSLPEDCLFCKLVQEGDHVAKADGFVAIRDIN